MVAILPALSAVGTFAGGAGSLAGALGLGGGGPSAGTPTGADYLSLYATQLAPGNTRLTIAAQQLAALTGPYIQGLNTSTALQGSQALGQFNQAAFQAENLTKLYTGVATGYANAGIGNEDLTAKYKTATEFLGPSAAADLTSKYADAASAFQARVLEGESSALNKVTEGQVLAGINASEERNRLASNIANTNLDIRKRQEDTKNALALQRGQFEAWRAKHAIGQSSALAGVKMFA